jgi:YVTN family beta-propeller protein
MSRVARAGATLACAIGLVCATTAGAASSKLPPRAKVVARIAIPEGTGGLAIGEGAVWALNWSNWTVMRIDRHSNAVTARIKVKPANACPPSPDTCGGVAAGNGAVWVSMRTDNAVARIDPRTNRVTAIIPVGTEPDGIATTPGAVWVANHGAPSVSRIDPATNQVVATISVGPATACCSDHMIVTAGAGSVWVTVPNLASLVRIDESTNTVTATIPLSAAGKAPACGEVAVNRDAVWISGAHCAAIVTRIDPRTNKPSGKVNGFASPIGVGLAFGSVWVADLDQKVVDRIDPRTRRIIGRLPVGEFLLPVLLSVGFGSIWVRDDSGYLLRIAPRR